MLTEPKFWGLFFFVSLYTVSHSDPYPGEEIIAILLATVASVENMSKGEKWRERILKLSSLMILNPGTTVQRTVKGLTLDSSEFPQARQCINGNSTGN